MEVEATEDEPIIRGLVTSPRNRRSLSPRDTTDIVVNGENVNRRTIPPISIPSPAMRPSSPRAAVPKSPHSARSRRSPSRLSSGRRSPTYITPLSPRTHIPSENPAILNVRGNVGAYVPTIAPLSPPHLTPERSISQSQNEGSITTTSETSTTQSEERLSETSTTQSEERLSETSTTQSEERLSETSVLQSQDEDGTTITSERSNDGDVTITSQDEDVTTITSERSNDGDVTITSQDEDTTTTTSERPNDEDVTTITSERSNDGDVTITSQDEQEEPQEMSETSHFAGSEIPSTNIEGAVLTSWDDGSVSMGSIGAGPLVDAGPISFNGTGGIYISSGGEDVSAAFIDSGEIRCDDEHQTQTSSNTRDQVPDDHETSFGPSYPPQNEIGGTGSISPRPQPRHTPPPMERSSGRDDHIRNEDHSRPHHITHNDHRRSSRTRSDGSQNPPQQDDLPKRRRRKKKRSARVNTYKSSVPPFLGPVLNAPEIPDYSSMTERERVGWRAEFRIKFGTLRRTFREYSIPEVDDDEPLEMVHARYERYLRHIYISGNADSYRNYLLLYFLVLELIATKALGLPASGFTAAQMNSMSKYERLLIELGEKWYVPGGEQWPVEYRIIFLSLFNMAIFILINWLGRWIGNSDLAEAIVNMVMGGVVNNEPSEGGGGGDGGLDLGTLLGALTGMMNNNNGGNTNTSDGQNPGGRQRRTRRRRGPVYRE